jgi:hypothetical protein
MLCSAALPCPALVVLRCLVLDWAVLLHCPATYVACQVSHDGLQQPWPCLREVCIHDRPQHLLQLRLDDVRRTATRTNTAAGQM